MRWINPDAENGSRFPEVLLRHAPLALTSAKQARKLIDAGLCSVNGRVSRLASTRVAAGDIVEVFAPASEKKCASLEVLYEDDWVILLNKPVGLIVEPDAVQQALPPGTPKIFLVHRLDKNTSGLLIVAKDFASKQHIEKQFRDRKVKKAYLAIVDGRVKLRRGVIDEPIEMKGRRHGEVCWGIGEEGKPARTRLTVVDATSQASFVYLVPTTGRTHQLRVHMACIGHPILGDYQYSDQFLCPLRPPRQQLHSWKIEFRHPMSQDLISWTADMPVDMQQVTKSLFGDDVERKLCEFSL